LPKKPEKENLPKGGKTERPWGVCLVPGEKRDRGTPKGFYQRKDEGELFNRGGEKGNLRTGLSKRTRRQGGGAGGEQVRGETRETSQERTEKRRRRLSNQKKLDPASASFEKKDIGPCRHNLSCRALLEGTVFTRRKKNKKIE